MSAFFEKQPRKVSVYLSHEMEFPPHLHNEVELIYIKKGTLTIINNNQRRTLTDGDIAVIFSNNIHEYIKEGDVEMTIFIICPRFIPEFTNTYTNKQATDFVIKNPDILPQIHIINDYFKQPAERHNDRLDRAYIHLLHGIVLNELELIARSTNSDVLLTNQVIKYVSTQFKAPISLQIIAENLDCSEYTVSRIFSHKLQISFPNYINQIRVDYAKTLLRESDLKIVDIALESGFESLRTFNRSFKSIYHETPNQYRKQFS